MEAEKKKRKIWKERKFELNEFKTEEKKVWKKKKKEIERERRESEKVKALIISRGL